ncbi:MAG: sigma-70 family RNA polymerase sigma factor [Anaerolineales bacterium]|nr:sigma-70 family RNA polymerase sigma factor [Anaerolineales bacterium]
MVYPGISIMEDEALSGLLEKAEVQGFITLSDIGESYPEPSSADFEQNRIIAYLRCQGIEVLEEEEILGSDSALSDFDNITPIDHYTTDDTIEIYLKEMARVPLLSIEEEIGLAMSIEKGREAQRQLKSANGRLKPEQRKDLDILVKEGMLSREHIIKANTRLVVSIAKKYLGRGLPFLDLIQEGNLGLMKAVEKFDYRRGFRFSTYATWWIRQTITRSIADQGRTIRLPVHMTDRIRHLYKVYHGMEQELGRPPTTQELATKLDTPIKKVQWMLQVSWIPLSLESPVGDEDDSELGMFVEDQITPTPSQVTHHNMLRKAVENVLTTLTPREARIIRLRYGLDDNHPYTLEEVGNKFGLTRERIRQIEGKALKRLRHPYRARLLREYF